MASPPHGNGFQSRTGHFYSRRQRRHEAVTSRYLHVLAMISRIAQNSAFCLKSIGLGFIASLGSRAVRQVRVDLTARRLFSFPHLLIFFWGLVLLWGEYWAHSSNVQACQWENWEDWPAGSHPHHLILIADPQLIDPHTYPDRGWPLGDLTIIITDNYLRRAYTQLRTKLQPDSLFFLGDLFDGGREWKTAQGDFSESQWAKEHRPREEKKYVQMWREKYGEDFWLSEFFRFGDLFFKPWNTGGEKAGAWQRGRKLVASLPGNHDLGFGDEIKLPVRDRFYAFFGDGNRVDVVGNHTIVSVDAVSLSAGSSDLRANFKHIFHPTDEFLRDVQHMKRRAVEQELRFWRGGVEELKMRHAVEDVELADVDHLPSFKEAAGENDDFPTIILTHVPLYREPGTPCGPEREHWPPAAKPPGQTDPVDPDPRNAIAIAKGYQYQNVLSEEDSIRLVKSVGNVVRVFSGDDHDYCEVTHNERKHNVHEITVKSMSMAMGVNLPGFLMVSLLNPVDGKGRPIPGAPEQTLQTHLCLLPDQISTFIRYAILAGLTVGSVLTRAMLMPFFHFTPFSLSTEPGSQSSTLLPTYKDKVEDDGSYYMKSTSATSGSAKYLSRLNDTTRTRSSSLTQSNGSRPSPRAKSPRRSKPKHWEPRIDIYKDDIYRDEKMRATLSVGVRPRMTIGLIVRDAFSCLWRVVWVAGLFWAYLTFYAG